MDIEEFIRLRDAVMWAKKEDAKGKKSLWDQNTYIARTDCGTTGCIAGRGVMAAGFVPAECQISGALSTSTQWYAEVEIPTDGTYVPEGVTPVPLLPYARESRLVLPIHDLAKSLFGLSDHEADELFDDDCSIEDVCMIAADASSRHGFDSSDWKSSLSDDDLRKKHSA